jgi:DNA-binding winged helix-turn-helix (wHTH) protein
MMSRSEECFAFANFRLYPSQRTLLHGTDLVAIGGRAFDVLHMLVSRAGTIVSMGELMDFVWPSVTVEEANLRVQMGMLRKVLSQCDQARRAIETIPLRGYSFILPVDHHHAPTAALPPVIGRQDVIDLVAAALEHRCLVMIGGPGAVAALREQLPGHPMVLVLDPSERIVELCHSASHGDRS